VLTIIGVGTGCLGTLFAYFLKSRCRKIKACGFECDRDVLDAKDVAREEVP
jgi:prephenate dehydrogenase